MSRTRVNLYHESMKRNVWVIGFIILSLILIRHLYLYHTGDIKVFLLWLKGNLGWEAALMAGIVYVILLSIPFFPGVELAWMVILLFGKDAVIMIYLLTLIGLGLSFGFGRWFEKSWLTKSLDIPKLKENLKKRTEWTKKRIADRLPVSLLKKQSNPFLFNSRYFIIAILINLPGNTIIGGGGGIALLCGMNRSFSWKGFILTIAIASSPIPLLLLFGMIQIETLLS
jgi:hypothetical protein